MSPIRADPVKAIDIIRFKLKLNDKMGLRRISPYPPSFSKSAAKIIDPITGASTWAFGSQRCPKKIGNLIKKAAVTLSKIK